MPADHENETLCELLPWDTAFFGVNIARVHADRLSESTARRVDEWCRERAVELLYFIAASDDPATIPLAQRHGYQLVDLRTTLEQSVHPSSSKVDKLSRLRVAYPEDAPALEALARESHTDSRFYYDGRLPAERCDELFATWVRNSVAGYADAVFVTGPAGQPGGYVTVKLDRVKLEGSIGLIAVAAGMRGQGLGRLLVEGALEWVTAEGMRTASVVTQGRNIAAMRLYERCGFIGRSLQLYFHKWFSP